MSRILKRVKKQTGTITDYDRDKNIKALPPGYRISAGGSANQYGTKKQNKGKKYYENRRNRSDVDRRRKL